MFTLRCTRKLLQRVVPAAAPVIGTHSTTALGDWYANLLRVGCGQFVIAMNERSLLVVLMPAKDLRRAIAGRLTETLAVWRQLDFTVATIRFAG